MANVIWIDANVHNKINSLYSKELKSMSALKVELFEEIDEAMCYLKKLEFEEIKIIVSGRLYAELVNNFEENINDMLVVPKIIVFTSDENGFIEYNPDYYDNENKFYSFGGIATDFQKVKNFLNDENYNSTKNDINSIAHYPQNFGPSISEIENVETSFYNEFGQVQLTFEYIDCLEKLMLPLFFKVLIEMDSDNNIEKFNNYLYQTYSKYDVLKNLLKAIDSIPNIPIELLSKFYARLYTTPSTFHFDVNNYLGLNKKDKYLTYIKTLYEGVKLKSLPLASDYNFLYRGSKISNDEINNIKNYINNKKEDLPGSIVFSKSFLSFSKEKKVAEAFLKNENINDNKNQSLVLFVLEKNDSIDYTLSTHGDIEKFSFYKGEKEVLFFPFSSFEIKDIREINIGEIKVNEIPLLYLGKYLKEIENKINAINIEDKLPESKFKNLLYEFGLINKEKIKNIKKKELYHNYKEYGKVRKKKEIKKLLKKKGTIP